jgi:hypothetical protein
MTVRRRALHGVTDKDTGVGRSIITFIGLDGDHPISLLGQVSSVGDSNQSAAYHD